MISGCGKTTKEEANNTTNQETLAQVSGQGTGQDTEKTESSGTEASGDDESQDAEVSRDLFAMDTYMTLTAYGEHAQEAVDKAAESVEALDALLSTGDENSEIYQLNQKKKMKVSDETLELIEFAKKKSKESNDAFDISIYPIVELWGFPTQKYRVPSDSEIQKLSSEIRTKREELKNTTERVMSVHYRAAVEYLVDKVGETILGQIKEKKVCACADLYWIDYIDDTVKKLLVDSKNKGNYRYTTGFLANHIWKEWTQYISGKYIELGKGVYHFAVPDLSGAVDGEMVSICEVKPKYRSGISGFDYERIKAEESLEREMEEYILFAVNNFARAVAPEEEREREGHDSDAVS